MLVLGVVGGRRDVAAGPRPIGVEELAAGAVYPFVGVCTEVVPLCLYEIGRYPFRSVGVEEGECGSVCRDRDPCSNRPLDGAAPPRLGRGNRRPEEIAQEDVLQALLQVFGSWA